MKGCSSDLRVACPFFSDLDYFCSSILSPAGRLKISHKAYSTRSTCPCPKRFLSLPTPKFENRKCPLTSIKLRDFKKQNRPCDIISHILFYMFLILLCILLPGAHSNIMLILVLHQVHIVLNNLVQIPPATGELVRQVLPVSCIHP